MTHYLWQHRDQYGRYWTHRNGVFSLGHFTVSMAAEDCNKFELFNDGRSVGLFDSYLAACDAAGRNDVKLWLR